MKKNRKYHFCRSIRTTQEKRNFCKNGLTEDGFRVKIRAKRSPGRLPDAWDDYFTRTPQCWKDHRKTQYKTEKNSFMFGFIPYGDCFKLGNKTFRKILRRWNEELFRINAVDVSDDSEHEFSYYDYVEYPIRSP